MSDKHKCAECADDDGVVQLIAIAWPGTEPFYLNKGPIDPKRPELGDRYVANPKANGFFAERRLLHPECETVHIARLEQVQEKNKRV